MALPSTEGKAENGSQAQYEEEFNPQHALETVLKVCSMSERPRYVDLVSDFAGQEFFILDGEALLQFVFRDPMLDLGDPKGG